LLEVGNTVLFGFAVDTVVGLCLVVGGTVVDDMLLFLVVGVGLVLLAVVDVAAFSPVTVSGSGLNIIHTHLHTYYKLNADSSLGLSLQAVTFKTV